VRSRRLAALAEAMAGTEKATSVAEPKRTDLEVEDSQ